MTAPDQSIIQAQSYGRPLDGQTAQPDLRAPGDRLADAALDASMFLSGHVSGETQRAGIDRELHTALAAWREATK